MPTDETLKKKRRDEENGVDYDADDEYDFKMTREYTWNIKSKQSSGYEENYYFIFKENGVFYNELETRCVDLCFSFLSWSFILFYFFRVRLSKRRNKAGKIGNTRLNVKYREYTKQEFKHQRLRAKDLDMINEDEEEEDDEEEEEENNEDNVQVDEENEEGDGEHEEAEGEGEEEAEHNNEEEAEEEEEEKEEQEEDDENKEEHEEEEEEEEANSE